MEYFAEEPSTPCFGNYVNNSNLFEELLIKRISKSTNDVSQYLKKNEEHKNIKKEKKQNKEKTKHKNKEKSKSRHKSSKSKTKKVSGISLSINQKYENPLDNFIKKKLKLRNDFDQNHSEKFLSEKELAFQQFQMNEDDVLLEN